MPSPTTAREILGHFLRGADPPAINQHASTPPVRLPTYPSLRAILAAGARGRGVWGGASGRKVPRDGGGSIAGEGGRNGNGTGRTRGELETKTRMTSTRRTTAEQAHRGRGQENTGIR